MADHHLAAPTTVVDLPPELRALADFLEPDLRPTVIFRDARNGQQERVYGNAAFERWRQQLGADELLLLLPATAAGKQLSNGGPVSRAPVLADALQQDGWEVRISGEYRIVVATALLQRDTPPATPKPSTKTFFDDGRRQSSDADVSHLANSVGGPVTRTSLDWTAAAATPDMSPWVKFLRSFDWEQTGAGAMESWSPVLRQQMLSITANPNPRTIIWGEDMTFIYNEACVQLFGSKHPDFMGVNASVAWASVWAEAGPLINAAYSGRAMQAKDLHLILDRSGFLEETYWDITSLPIYSEDGSAIGAVSELLECTLRVTGERRRQALDVMSRSVSMASSLHELWPAVIKGVEAAGVDIPFCLLYAVVDHVSEDIDAFTENTSPTNYPKKCVLAGSVGIDLHHSDVLEAFPLYNLSERDAGLTNVLHEVWKTQKTIKICREDGTLPAHLASSVPERSFGDPIRKALVSPLCSTGGSEPRAILVAGISPRCALNSEYNLFIHLVLDLIEKAATLISLPEEQRRAQQMADEVNNALAHQLRLTTLQAERSEARFSRLADTAPTGMYMFNSDGRLLYANDAYLALFNQTREEAAMKKFETEDWRAFIHPDDLESFLQGWVIISEQKVPVTVEYRLNRPYRSVDKSTGQEIIGETWVVANAFPEIEADGKIATVQGWLTDISHRKFSENMLAQRLQDALETKRQSENFIDMTSHEMRNPLSAILQSADSVVSTLDISNLSVVDGNIILPSAIAAEVMDAAQTIILCAQHQKRIVDDILTLSKLDASLLVICPDKVQPPTLVARALKMYEAEISRAGIDAQLCIEPAYHQLEVDWVVLDPSRLLQVVINLLTNAIKFTQYSDTRKIMICLGASREQPTGQHHGISFIPPRNVRNPHSPQLEWGQGEDIYIQIAVIDTGRGLSTDEMSTLFQRFQQASPKTYKQYGGSGLGLFISRELCELQGGQIGAASGNGTTRFTFFVRAKRWVPESGRVNLVKPHLSRYSSAPPETTASHPETERTLRQDVPNALGLTYMQDAMLAAAEAERSKALHRSSSMQRLLSPTATALPGTGELHVLIVEDNLINQKVMSQQLRKAGCTVHVANHGGECLSFIEQSAFCSASPPGAAVPATPLSVILLDLEMPTMDGLTCIRHIRQRQLSGEITGHVPVIAVTANARSEQISVALDAGMDHVVTKPFRIPELVPQMRKLVAELTAVKGSDT